MTKDVHPNTLALNTSPSSARRYTSALAQARSGLKALILPLLLAAFPPLFHYADNTDIVLLPSLWRTLLLYLILAAAVYGVCLALTRGKTLRAANAAFVFLIIFNVYGLVYSYLFKLDIVQVEDYTLLPLFLLLGIYASWLVAKIKPRSFWNVSVLIVGVLVAFNVVRIIPAEVQKYGRAHPAPIRAATIQSPAAGKNYPDIYYILFDEFAGMDVMRSYWHYQGVDAFASFLKSKGFYVAEHSQGNSIDTLHLMYERLNYEQRDYNWNDINTYYDGIAHNRVMSYLKSIGYTTVTFDETNFGYPAAPPIVADYSYVYGSSAVSKQAVDPGTLFDDFGVLVAQNTMLRAFPIYYGKSIDPFFGKHKEMVYFTQQRITNLSDIPSPRMVYVHLLMPHYPFMFSENGSVNPPQLYYNWTYYLGNYQFTIGYAEKIVNEILAESDPARPPVIILQSDHGARNIVVDTRGGVPLENYPEQDKTHILNALLLPGCDQSVLTQDMNPINTFPVVLNCYFHAGIPLLK